MFSQQDYKARSEKPSKTETQNATRDNLNEAGLIKEMNLYTILDWIKSRNRKKSAKGRRKKKDEKRGGGKMGKKWGSKGAQKAFLVCKTRITKRQKKEDSVKKKTWYFILSSREVIKLWMEGVMFFQLLIRYDLKGQG